MKLRTILFVSWSALLLAGLVSRAVLSPSSAATVVILGLALVVDALRTTPSFVMIVRNPANRGRASMAAAWFPLSLVFIVIGIIDLARGDLRGAFTASVGTNLWICGLIVLRQAVGSSSGE